MLLPVHGLEDFMKLALLIAMQASITLFPPDSGAQQRVTEEPTAAVKACIAANAPDVERSIEPLSEAADFLVKKVCAGPISDQMEEASRKEAATQKARWDDICAKQPAQAPQSAQALDPDNYDYAAQMCKYRDMYDETLTSAFSVSPFANNEISAPKAMSLAAQTLLKLRAERTGKKR
jgi:hypothetical protein